MIAIPAVDLRDGACVQLVGGSYADERVRIADPLVAARRWTDAGFQRLHIVDLDAATGVGNNTRAISALLSDRAADVQVGGGVRSTERIAVLLDSGARHVVAGTRAIEDEQWLREVAAFYPDRIIVAADVRGRCVVTRGWAERTTLDVGAFIARVSGLPIAGVLVTAVDQEGLMEGTDLPLMKDLAGATTVPIIASGGIATLDELRALAHAGISAAVLGMALYTGALDARAVATEFNS
jgi:phosphoribosylformimino-5-aminoimidazole carboxamide ribotide isomerase